MKKIIYFAISMLFLFILASCDKGGVTETTCSLSYKNSTEEMYVGQTINVEPVVTGGVLTLKYQLSSDIATLDEKGNLTAIEKGTITITVTAVEDPNLKAILLVLVKEKQIEQSVEYTITLDVNGGDDLEQSSVTDEAGTPIQLPTPTKEGYNFKGWYNGEVIFEETIMPKENLTLVAKWEEIIINYTIIYDVNGGVLPEDVTTSFIEGEIVLLPTPTKEGYKFLGWYENEILVENITSKDYILVAKWEENKILLNLETFGGTVDNKATYDDYGNIIIPTPILEGYKFKYWCFDSLLETKVESLSINNYNGEKLYAFYELDNEKLKSSIVVTKYNQHASNYDELVMFDSSKTGITSRYWQKILIIEQNNKYYVSNIGDNTTKLSDLGDYDYLILAYSNYKYYKHIVNLDCEIGYEVEFLVNPSTIINGSCTNIISFSERNLDNDVEEIYNYLNEKYSTIDIIDEDIELVKEYNSYNIEWVTSNRESLTNEGKYIKPFVNRIVTLEAYIGSNKVYEFEVEVEGYNEKSVALSTGYIYTPYSTITQTAMDCLDIIYCAFLNLDSNGDWTNLKTITNNINNYIREKANKAGTKIIISINQKNSGDFSNVAKSEILREKVATNILNVIKTLNLDGVDIDWETPASSEAGNFTLFMKTIYEKVKSENKNYLVTAAIGGGKWAPPKYDLTNSINYLDYINMMTYSMATGNGYYQNSLYPSTRSRTLVSCSIDESITIYNNFGVPNSKILVGIPFYTTVQTECEGVGTKTGNGKSIWYDKLFTTYALSDTMKEFFDEECCVPYRYDAANKIFISFDNEQSIKMKCDYINSLGLAGTMYWQYGQDVNDMLSLAIAKYINA